MSMKRLMICLVAWMTICIQGLAADITGKWKTTLVDDGMEIPCELNITKTDILFAVNMEEEDDEIGVIAMSIKIPASYTIDGNKLSIALKKEGVELKLKELKPKDPDLKAMMEKDDETKKTVMGMLEGALDVYKDKMVGDENFLGGDLTIKEITPTTLTLQDETGEEIIFTRIQE